MDLKKSEFMPEINRISISMKLSLTQSYTPFITLYLCSPVGKMLINLHGTTYILLTCNAE